MIVSLKRRISRRKQKCQSDRRTCRRLTRHLATPDSLARADPDEPVRDRVNRAEVQLGIEVPIPPGGVFLPTDETAADATLDVYHQDVNYDSYAEHRGGAEAILHKEIDSGWIDWQKGPR